MTVHQHQHEPQQHAQPQPKSERDFWKHFNEKIWERVPAHLGSTVPPLLSREEMFSLAVLIGDLLAEGDKSQRIRWCDDGKNTVLLPPTEQSAAFLPRQSDNTLLGYNERMKSFEMFFFQIPTLQLFCPELWPRLMKFARHFYPNTGVPGSMAWTDAIFGRYTATPFGVHLDGASNFTFGIEGYKTLYLWEPEFFEANMKGVGDEPNRSYDYKPFASSATKLTVGPGELIYWPGRFFHIAVPDGTFSVTQNYAFYFQQPQAEWLKHAFHDLLASSPETEAKQAPFRGSALPDDLVKVCRSFVAKISDGALERQLLKHIVEHTTRFGFHHPPPQRTSEVHFQTGDRVFLMPGCELACVPDGAGSVVISANGYSVIVPETDSVTKTIGVLKSGQKLVVEADTQTLVDEMHRWSAVERYWG